MVSYRCGVCMDRELTLAVLETVVDSALEQLLADRSSKHEHVLLLTMIANVIGVLNP